jgi:uncharacterized protein with HEPN domain
MVYGGIMTYSAQRILDETDLRQLQYMMESASTAIAFAKDQTPEKLFSDNKRVFALVRAIELVGESAASISPMAKRYYPNFPWSYAAGISERFSFNDSDINLDRVWLTVTQELPVLVTKLSRIIPPEFR